MNHAGMPERPPRTTAYWTLAAIATLVFTSFWSLDLRWHDFLDSGSLRNMRDFIVGFAPPTSDTDFLAKLASASLETIGMSAIGTLIATVFALALAIPASAKPNQSRTRIAGRQLTRLLLNTMRSIPELVWAALLVIAAGLGPFPGTLALAAHTTGVLGRLFADSLENLPDAPANALRDNGVSAIAIFTWATLPLALTQMTSYVLYRWENNIRAATVLGVVGAGGLGQMLHVHLSLFQMHDAASVIIAMLVLVACVDGASYVIRRRLTR